MAEKTVNVHSISHKMRQKAIWKGIIWGIIRWIFYLSIIYVIVYPILYVLSGSFKSYSDMLNPASLKNAVTLPDVSLSVLTVNEPNSRLTG